MSFPEFPGPAVPSRRVPATPPVRIAALAILALGLAASESAAEPASEVPRVAGVTPGLLTEANGPARGGAVIFSDGFESGTGAWTVTDVSGGGAWWGDADCWASEGTRSAACAAAGPAATGCGENYPDDLKTWMVYGPFDLSDPSIRWAETEFDLKLHCEPDFDRFFAGISADGLDFVGTSLTGVQEGTFALSVDDCVGESQVWIGFQFFSDGSGGRVEGAHIDNVVIRRSVPPGPGTPYGWTLSGSNTDPEVHTGPALPGFGTVYLWELCSTPADIGGADGVSAFRATITASNGGFIAGFTPASGVLNAGTASDVMLAIGGCPVDPMLIGAFTVIGATTELCLGNPISMDCYPAPQEHASSVVGYAAGGGIPCQVGPSCSPTAVERRSWSSLKALYR